MHTAEVVAIPGETKTPPKNIYITVYTSLSSTMTSNPTKKHFTHTMALFIVQTYLSDTTSDAASTT